MFLNLNHKSLKVYQLIRELVKEIYKISYLPAEEKFNMIQQIRRAAHSVKLNFSEGSTRRSIVERKRFYEIARGSLVEVDPILETAVDLNYFTMETFRPFAFERILNQTFAMLSKLISA